MLKSRKEEQIQNYKLKNKNKSKMRLFKQKKNIRVQKYENQKKTILKFN